METFTFEFRGSDFDDLMKRKTGLPKMEADIFARIARLNRAGHRVVIVDKDTHQLIHEFLPIPRSSRTSTAPTTSPPGAEDEG